MDGQFLLRNARIVANGIKEIRTKAPVLSVLENSAAGICMTQEELFKQLLEEIIHANASVAKALIINAPSYDETRQRQLYHEQMIAVCIAVKERIERINKTFGLSLSINALRKPTFEQVL